MLRSSPTIKWGAEKLYWRFKKNPTQKYYSLQKGKDYYIFKKIRKNFFLLVGRTNINLNLTVINPTICFSYDYETNGLPIRFRESWMYKSKLSYKFNSYLFDET